MKSFHLTLAALLCVSSAALAQDAPRAVSPGAGYPVVASAGAPSGRIVRNANDCAPDRPQPVWGAGQTLVGYVCSGSTR